MRVFGRRKPLEKWSQRELAECVLGGIASDPDERYVRTGYVFEHDYSRLPADTERKAIQEAESQGQEWEGLKPFTAFYFDFDDGDRLTAFMEHDRAGIARGWDPFASFAEASQTVAEWAGADGRKTTEWLPFDYTPGIYQAGLFELLLGRQLEAHPADFMWAMPGDDGADWLVVREYPPKVSEDARFQLVAADAVHAMIASRY